MKQSLSRSLFLLLLLGCSKSRPALKPPPYSVTASINGTPMTFNSIITVDSLSTPGTVYIVAHSDSANLTPLLEITLSTTPLKATEYTLTELTDSTTGNLGLVGYTGWNHDTALQYNAVTDTVTLATVNKTWLAGSFQGACRYVSDSTTTFATVTNGQFAVGWDQH